MLCTAAALAGAGQAQAFVYAPLIGFEIDDGTQDDGFASCSGADYLMGGGFRSNSDFLDSVYLNTLQPGEGNVHVYADNYADGIGDVDAEVQAVCDSEGAPGDYSLKTDGPHQVPDGSELGFVAKCTGGDPVIGGGVVDEVGYSGESYVNSLGPVDLRDRDKAPDDGWRAEVNNRQDGGAETVEVTTYAVCDSKHEKLRYRSRTMKVVDGAAEGQDGVMQQGRAADGRRPHLHLHLQAGRLPHRQLPDPRGRLVRAGPQLGHAGRQGAQRDHHGYLPLRRKPGAVNRNEKGPRRSGALSELWCLGAWAEAS